MLNPRFFTMWISFLWTRHMIALKSLFICESLMVIVIMIAIITFLENPFCKCIVFTFPGPANLAPAKMIPVRDQIVITKMMLIFQIFSIFCLPDLLIFCLLDLLIFCLPDPLIFCLPDQRILTSFASCCPIANW